MSIENHPNLHAIAFLTDIAKSLERNLRGRAGEVRGTILQLMLPRIKVFVDETDEAIDVACKFIDTEFNEWKNRNSQS